MFSFHSPNPAFYNDVTPKEDGFGSELRTGLIIKWTNLTSFHNEGVISIWFEQFRDNLMKTVGRYGKDLVNLKGLTYISQKFILISLSWILCRIFDVSTLYAITHRILSETRSINGITGLIGTCTAIIFTVISMVLRFAFCNIWQSRFIV